MHTSITKGLNLPRTEKSKDKNKGLPSIFYTIFKADVLIWFRLKNYWNGTFSGSVIFRQMSLPLDSCFLYQWLTFLFFSKCNLEYTFFTPNTSAGGRYRFFFSVQSSFSGTLAEMLFVCICHFFSQVPWVFTGRTDAEAETPILWPPHAKS